MLQTLEEFRLTNTNARPTLRRARRQKAYTSRYRFRKCPREMVVRFGMITFLALSSLFCYGRICVFAFLRSGGNRYVGQRANRLIEVNLQAVDEATHRRDWLR